MKGAGNFQIGWLNGVHFDGLSLYLETIELSLLASLKGILSCFSSFKNNYQLPLPRDYMMGLQEEIKIS